VVIIIIKASKELSRHKWSECDANQQMKKVLPSAPSYRHDIPRNSPAQPSPAQPSPAQPSSSVYGRVLHVSWCCVYTGSFLHNVPRSEEEKNKHLSPST
jgi:hypothetical protein